MFHYRETLQAVYKYVEVQIKKPMFSRAHLKSMTTSEGDGSSALSDRITVIEQSKIDVYFFLVWFYITVIVIHRNKI